MFFNNVKLSSTSSSWVTLNALVWCLLAILSMVAGWPRICSTNLRFGDPFEGEVALPSQVNIGFEESLQDMKEKLKKVQGPFTLWQSNGEGQ